MHQLPLAFFTLALITLTACSARPPALVPAPASDAQLIDAMIHELGEAFSTGDETLFFGLLADDPVWMPPDRGMLSGREAIAAWFRESQAELAQHLCFAVVDVRIHGDWALVQTEVRGTLAPRAGGADVAIDNKALFVLQRQETGRWLFWRDAWNRNRPSTR